MVVAVLSLVLDKASVVVVMPDEAAGGRLSMIGRVWEVVKSYIADAGRRRQRMWWWTRERLW
jgi:hypothetical protein